MSLLLLVLSKGSTNSTITFMARPIGNLAFPRTILRYFTATTGHQDFSLLYLAATIAFSNFWKILPCLLVFFFQAQAGKPFGVKLQYVSFTGSEWQRPGSLDRCDMKCCIHEFTFTFVVFNIQDGHADTTCYFVVIFSLNRMPIAICRCSSLLHTFGCASNIHLMASMIRLSNVSLNVFMNLETA